MISGLIGVIGGWGEKWERERVFQAEGTAMFRRIQGKASHFSLCGRVLLGLSSPPKSPLLSVASLSAINSLSPWITLLQFMLWEPRVDLWSRQSGFLSGTKALDENIDYASD